MVNGRPLSTREIKVLERLPRSIMLMRWMGSGSIAVILWAAFNHYRFAMLAGKQCGLNGFLEVFHFYLMDNPAKRMYSLAELYVVGQSGAWMMSMMVAFQLALFIYSWQRQANLLMKIHNSSKPESPPNPSLDRSAAR
jgi:hypothetical protein